ncbi:MAG: tRNA pseudouridine(55) synthase TruB [Ferruginibacter sp.]
MGKKGSYWANHKKRTGTEGQPVERKRPDPISEEKKLAFEEGQVILLDKPLHWTSFDAVRKIRNAIRIKKVGHAGTLDPLASGLLIICTGRFTKKINEYMAAEKEYTGSFTLGATTPTYDLESNPENDQPTEHITGEQVKAACQPFIGSIMQLPPLYSAIKKEGVALYELARRGKDVELEPRPIFIREFEITAIQKPVVHFRVVCSTGTYIRSLAHDFGKALGCGAYLSELRRTRIGSFEVKEAVSIDGFITSLAAPAEDNTESE